MKLLNPADDLPGQDSMLIFHAMAYLGREALILVSPASPIASIGYFQDTNKVLDLDYCRAHNIPLMRREVGGGTTYLDSDQIFYQVVLKKDNPLAPRRIANIYTKFSYPSIETYKAFGIEASLKPINDIITAKGKKIAGEGGADIGDCIVFVGGILLDFNYQAMSKILKVPDEKFRDKVYKSMEENLTTMKRELGYKPSKDEVKKVLISKFEEILGPLEPVEIDDELEAEMRELEKRFMSEEFLFRKGKATPDQVRIAEGVNVQQRNYKARGGLITTVVEIKNKTINDISLSGDFTFYPKEKLADLEKALLGIKLNRDDIIRRVESFYEEEQAQSPGVSAEDIAEAIVGEQ